MRATETDNTEADKSTDRVGLIQNLIIIQDLFFEISKSPER
jgi:hypothetical protein